MERKLLRSAKLRSAAYDERDERLEIEFTNGDVRIYKGVQAEVARRLFSAPNAEPFWEDRIAEEYPYETRRGGGDPDSRAQLDSLFGKP
jgi:hypothetical protein